VITILKFSAFVSAVLLVVIGAHYLLYTSAIRFFSISELAGQRILMWVMVFFALSFLPSALLLRLQVNFLTQAWYITSCVWLGVFLYLLMAVALVWLIWGAGLLMGRAPDMRLISAGLFLLALGISLYGIWKARNPELKQLEVEIEGLPDQWHDRLLVQLSDVHLGVINGRGFLGRVVEKVNRLNPDLIVITGDLFDGMGGHFQDFVEPLNLLGARKGIFFVTGNHEGYLGLREPLAAIRKTKIRVLDDEVVNVDGLLIVGISFPEYNRQNNVRRLLESEGFFDADKPSILLYHTPTDIADHHTDRGNQQARTYWFPNTSMRLAKEAGIDLQLSGHTHQGQIFPLGLITRAIFKGYDYGLHRDGKFHVYVSSGVGTWGPPMRTGGASEIVAIRLLQK
jgi:predicted MPP superfamily phosphohydrolase